MPEVGRPLGATPIRDMNSVRDSSDSRSALAGRWLTVELGRQQRLRRHKGDASRRMANSPISREGMPEVNIPAVLNGTPSGLAVHAFAPDRRSTHVACSSGQ